MKTKSKRALYLGLGLILIGAALLLVRPTQRSKELIVATVSRDWFNAPLVLADAEHDDSHLRVRTLDQKSGLASKIAVESGHAKVGLASPVPLLRDENSWSEIVILGVYMSSDSVVGIVTRNGSIQSLSTPIGIVGGTISELFLASALKKNTPSITVADLQTLEIQPPDAGTLMKNQSINTVVIWEPHLTRALQMTAPETQLLLPPGTYTVNVALITSRSALQTHRSEIEIYRNLVSSQCEKIKSDPDTSREKIQELLKLDPTLLERAWGTVDFTFRSNKEAVSKILNEEMDALEQANLLPDTARSHALKMLEY